MKRLLLPLGLTVLACARPPVPAPDLFPLRSAWKVAVDHEILTPLAANATRIFVSARGGGVRALDPGTGAKVWHDTDREGWLTAEENALFVRASDGRVWRLDPLSGAPRWQAASGIPGEVAPLLAEGRLIVAGQGVAAVDPVSGHLLWSVPDAPETLLPAAAGNGRIVLVERDGTVRCRDAATGAALWEHSFPSQLLAGAAVGESRVYLGTTDRRFVALDLLQDGRQRWRWKLGADVEGPAVLLHGQVLFASIENVLYALSAKSGNLAWRRTFSARPLGGPQLLGSAVVLATRSRELLGFNGIGGRRMGTLSFEADLATPPVAVADLLVAGLRDRSVAAATMSQPVPLPGEPAKLLDK